MSDEFENTFIAITPTIGQLLDNSFGTTAGAKIFGVAGVGMDIANRAMDEKGFTLRDGFAVLGNVGGGVAAGAALGGLGANPFTVVIGGAAGGFAFALGIDHLPAPADFSNLSHRPVVNIYTNGDGTRSIEKTYILGSGANGTEILQTERKIYSADGQFLKQDVLRTEVLDGGAALNQFRAVAFDQMFQQKHGHSLPSGARINECFPAGTEIHLSDGSTKPIENIRTGDEVAAFDGDVFGGLEGKRVVRLFENITDSWIKLSNGLTVTPGHRFLDSKGGFRSVDAILADDGIVIDENGAELSVSGEIIRYSEETADLFEQAEGYVAQSNGAVALAPIYKKGWKTYNFEVEGFHTYVAGGIRVHNDSYDFVKEGTETKVWPHLVSRYNHETGTFGQAVVWNTTNSSPSEISSALSQVKSSDGSVGHVSDYLPNGAQITGDGPVVTLASGTTVNAGTIFNPGNGYTSVVNANGSVTNLDTGVTSGVGTQRYNASTNDWETVQAPTTSRQITGSGPIVTLASGTQVNAGTQVTSSDGSYWTVNNDGSTTSSSGHTYGNGTLRYNPSTNNWDTVGPPQSSDDGDSGGSSSGKPVLLDLDGNGIEITTLSSSNFFFDMSGDGKLNRTAWAGAGDGVLVRDAGDDGIIEQRNEVDFTSWAPGAKIRGTFLGGKVGVKLMRVVSDWARAQGAEELHIYSTAGIDPAHSDRFFRRLGFQPYGGNYVARLG